MITYDPGLRYYLNNIVNSGDCEYNAYCDKHNPPFSQASRPLHPQLVN